MLLRDKNLYFVGGIVRDNILGIKNFDTDYCYEGDAIAFAKEKGLNVIKENTAFGTVRVLSEGKEIDIASTREESYPNKGHLPVVKNIGCSLEKDLKRRDFTINTLLKRTTDGEIIDFYGGIEDIKRKKIKILHDESFIDDPTRIIRALKFAVRLGFELDEKTLLLQNQYLNNINYDMSYHRLKKELIETFNLNKQEAFDKFINQGLYKLLGENQVIPKNIINIQNVINDFNTDYVWLIYLSFFDLSNIDLTRKERRIIECSYKLKNEIKNNNTPLESVIINKLMIN